MHGAAKIFLGAIMMIGSVYAVYYSIGTTWDLWSAFLTVLMGVIPLLIFLVGLFIVWLELDELKIEKELKKEGKLKPAKRTKKR